jgi:exodeoxyribonuclease VII small subunit
MSEELTFETAMARLEKIVAKLDGGDLPLEEALNLFTEGSRLAQFCSSMLDDADARVEMLLTTEDGTSQVADAGDSLQSAGGGAR